MEKQKQGRPKLPEGETRGRRVQMRLTDEEYESMLFVKKEIGALSLTAAIVEVMKDRELEIWKNKHGSKKGG